MQTYKQAVETIKKLEERVGKLEALLEQLLEELPQRLANAVAAGMKQAK